MGAQSNFPIVASNMNFNSSTIKNGGQKVSSNVWDNAYANVAVPLTGKWYWEYITDNYVYAWGGIGRPNYGGTNQHNVDFSFVQGGEYRYNGTNQANTSSIGTGSIVGVYVNDGVIKVYVNNSLDHTYSQNLSIIGSEELYPCFTGSSNVTVNFGQDSSFLGVKTAQGNTDANGVGDFYYTPPDSSLALASANLPTSTDIDPNLTDDDIPTKNFGVVTFAGNGTSNAVTGLGFKPDLIWGFTRSGGQSKRMVDSSRGGSSRVHSDTTGIATTGTVVISEFGTDGFTANGGQFNNDNGVTCGAWCWRANGGTTSTNTTGTITTTVQTLSAAGFSIVLYTGGNGTWGSTHQDTIGHGLSAAPEFMLFKEYSGTADAWTVFHHSVGAGGGTTAAHNNLRLDNSDALYTNQSYKSFGGVMPTSTVVTVEGNTTNSTGVSHLAYIWHGVDGYSKFGTYEGNGNANGPFIYLGFKPRLIFFKSVDGTSGWTTVDLGVYPKNTINGPERIEWNSGTASVTGTSATREMEILGNGVKIRTSNSNVNTSGNSYVFGAWADNPHKYGNAQ